MYTLLLALAVMSNGTISGETGATAETGGDYQETSFIAGADGDNAHNLPDVPLAPLEEVQQQLDAFGDRIQGLRGELRQTAR